MNNWNKVEKKQNLNEFYIKHYSIIAIYLILVVMGVWLLT